MGRRFSARVENGAHQHGEVWQEGGGCGVAAAENTMLGTRFLRVLRAFAVKVQPRIHREAAKSAKIPRRKILSCQQRIFCAFSWECGELETLSPALRDAPRDDLRVLRASAVRFFGCGLAALCKFAFICGFILRSPGRRKFFPAASGLIRSQHPRRFENVRHFWKKEFFQWRAVRNGGVQGRYAQDRPIEILEGLLANDGSDLTRNPSCSRVLVQDEDLVVSPHRLQDGFLIERKQAS